MGGTGITFSQFKIRQIYKGIYSWIGKQKNANTLLLQPCIKLVILRSWKLIALFFCLLLNETDRSGVMTITSGFHVPVPAMFVLWIPDT